MFSRLFKKLGKIETRRQQSRGAESGIESLEKRELMTADLKFNSAFMSLSDASGGNYLLNVQYDLANVGNTDANLSGIPNFANDNVTIRMWASQDQVLNGNDPVLVQSTMPYNDTGTKMLNAGSVLTSAFSVVVAPNSQYKYLFLKVDINNVISESNETNNTIMIEAYKPQISNNFFGIVTAPVKEDVTFAGNSSACDLNSTGFYRLDVEVSGAEAKDKLKLVKSGKGQDALRVVGGNLKLGSKVVGTVIASGEGTSTLKLKFQFLQDVKGISKDVMDRVVKNVAFRAGAQSTGFRIASLTLMDNQSAVGPTATRPLKIMS
ncbi:MAG: hypothetical protein KDA68_14390 [Planctomycetaceae bacterium]|nr:hypothetical protein [Planctomycetaceae bacterium]